jgi:hypothetical protein
LITASVYRHTGTSSSIKASINRGGLLAFYGTLDPENRLVLRSVLMPMQVAKPTKAFLSLSDQASLRLVGSPRRPQLCIHA